MRCDSRQDPEVTYKMRMEEFEYAYKNAMFTRIDMERQHPEDTWIQVYLSFIRERMDCELSIARHELVETTDPKIIHFWRRIIAFFHQELELNSQGNNVWNAAHDAEAMVMLGRGYVLLAASPFCRTYSNICIG